jgi:hypothetical protein
MREHRMRVRSRALIHYRPEIFFYAVSALDPMLSFRA